MKNRINNITIIVIIIFFDFISCDQTMHSPFDLFAGKSALAAVKNHSINLYKDDNNRNKKVIPTEVI